MRRFFDEDGNELDPDDFDSVEDTEEGLNFADVALVLALPFIGFVQGLSVAATYLQSGLQVSSRRIDEKKGFAREAGLTIESLTGGD